MPINARVSGSPVSPAVWAKAGGAIHHITTGYVKVGGVYRPFYSYSSFTPYTSKISGANTPLNDLTTGNLVVPTGATHATITLMQGGGPGVDASWSGWDSGGGSGGRSIYDIDLTSADWGKNVAYSLRNKSWTNGFTYAGSTASCAFTNGTMSLSGTPGRRGYDTLPAVGGTGSGGNTSNTTGNSGTSTQGGASLDGTPGGLFGYAGSNSSGGGPQGTTGYGGEASLQADWR